LYTFRITVSQCTCRQPLVVENTHVHDVGPTHGSRY